MDDSALSLGISIKSICQLLLKLIPVHSWGFSPVGLCPPTGEPPQSQSGVRWEEDVQCQCQLRELNLTTFLIILCKQDKLNHNTTAEIQKTNILCWGAQACKKRMVCIHKGACEQIVKYSTIKAYISTTATSEWPSFHMQTVIVVITVIEGLFILIKNWARGIQLFVGQNVKGSTNTNFLPIQELML